MSDYEQAWQAQRSNTLKREELHPVPIDGHNYYQLGQNGLDVGDVRG